MLKCRRGHHPPAWGALEEAELQQKRLNGFLDRVARFRQRGGDGFDPHGAAVVMIGNKTQVAMIRGIQPQRIHIQTQDEVGQLAANFNQLVESLHKLIGHIRQAALGEALLPFGERVARAMQRIHAQRAWTPVQRRWLDRLAKQLVLEVVIDPDFVNRAFATDGGTRQLDKLLGGQLSPVLDDLATHLWSRSA